jgi:hypothetical protein
MQQICRAPVANDPGSKPLFRNCGLAADTPAHNPARGLSYWYCAKHAAEAQSFFDRTGASELTRLDQTRKD